MRLQVKGRNLEVSDSIRKYAEEKRRRRQGRDNGLPPVTGVPVVEGEDEPVIVKAKQFAVKPMTPEEAVLQLELVGHDFFVFQNADTMDVNVVYRRRDGSYGLIEPSEEEAEDRGIHPGTDSRLDRTGG